MQLWNTCKKKKDSFEWYKKVIESNGEKLVKKYLVLDVGGSAIKYAVMDAEKNIYERGKQLYSLRLP